MLDWTEQAFCRGLPTSWWFPDGKGAFNVGSPHRWAERICQECPVKADCLDYVRHLPSADRRYGIWGGVNLATEIRKGRIKPNARKKRIKVAKVK